MNKEEIIEFLRAHKPYIEQHFGVLRIGLFGSYVRGDAREDSDIDIAVEMLDENIFRIFFRLERYLKEHLKKEIDLGIEGAIKPYARQSVMKEIIYV